MKASVLLVLIAALLLACGTAQAHDPSASLPAAGWGSVTTFSIIMALFYGIHLAQDRSSLGWRVLFFILGFPLTFVLSFLVAPGSQRLLGVDLPRHDRQPAPAATSEDEADPSDSDAVRAAWTAMQPLLIGVAIVILLAPSSRMVQQPLEDQRYEVVESTSWGWIGQPWLIYQREGVRIYDEPGALPEERWERGYWLFEPSPEMLLTIAVLIILFVLFYRDEKRRSLELEESRSDPA